MEDNEQQKTVAIIKPDAFKHAEEIQDVIGKTGLSIIQRKEVELTVDQACEFYSEHLCKPFYKDLVEYMTSGTVMVLLLQGENAIQQWRDLIGPTDVSQAKETNPDSLRARFGTDDGKNGLHGSDSATSASREISFFFSDATSKPSTPRSQPAKEYLAETVNPTLLRGLAQLCKNKPPDPIVWLADWLLINNPSTANTVPA